MESNSSSSKRSNCVGRSNLHRMADLSDDGIRCKSKRLKAPEILGLDQNGKEIKLILYLIGRRKYPVQNMSIEDQEKIETRKKAAGAALVFMTLGAIGFVINIMRIYI